MTGVNPNGFIFRSVKHFICDDGTGEIFVNVQARIDSSGNTAFNWNVIGGIGGYEGLRGTGSGVGLPCIPDCVLDIYDGGLHID